MPNNEIIIKGMDKLEKKFAKLGREFPPVMRELAMESALFIHSKLPPYPPPRAGASTRRRDQRKGTLGRTITTKAKQVSAKEYHGAIGSSQPYAPWVISEEVGKNLAGPQAWFHQGVWWTLQQVIRDNTKGIVKLYRTRIRKLMRDS